MVNCLDNSIMSLFQASYERPAMTWSKLSLVCVFCTIFLAVHDPVSLLWILRFLQTSCPTVAKIVMLFVDNRFFNFVHIYLIFTVLLFALRIEFYCWHHICHLPTLRKISLSAVTTTPSLASVVDFSMKYFRKLSICW